MRGAISCIWHVCFAPIYSVLSVINFELSSTVNTCLWDTWKEKAWFWSSTTTEKNSMELKFHKELAWMLKWSSHIMTPHEAFKTLYWMVIPFQLAIDREWETKLWIDCRMQWWIVSLTMPRDHRYSVVIWPAILWCYGDECCQSRSIVVLLTHYHNLPDLLMLMMTNNVIRSWLKPRLEVPKLPTVDQLHNDGKPAFPEWKKPKNPRMKHSKFRGLIQLKICSRAE